MSHELPLVLNITVALSIAFAGGMLATWLKQSPIVGYLLAGVAIGPFTPGFVGDRAQIAALADVGVIFLMFALGVAFSLKDLARIRNVATFGTLIQVGLTICGGTVLALAFGVPLFEGIFIGSALAASSSMVILKTLLDRGEVAAGHGRLLLSMSIVQDLIIVVLIVLLPKLGTWSETATATVFTDMGLTLAKAAGFIAFSLLVGLRVVPKIMAHVTRLQSTELFIVTAAVFALGAATVCTLLGLSAALGAFVAGLVLSESEFDHRVIAEIVPIRDLFATLFFVSIGMLVDVHFVADHWQWVIGAAALVIMVKALSTLLGVLPFRLTPRTAAFTSLGMIPVGELNFVLAQSGLESQILSIGSYKLLLTSALVTIVVTPLAFRVAPRAGELFARAPGLRHWFDSYSNVTGTSGTLEAHAVVIGYGRVGHSIALGLKHAGMSVVVIDSRLSRVREAGSQGFFAVYGNAASQTVLEAAHLKNARLVVVALTDHAPALATIQQIRQLNPEVLITARAEYSVHEAALYQAGANLVIVPELEGATTLFNNTLDALGLPR